MRKNKEMNKSDGNDYSINSNDEKMKKEMNKKKEKLPDGNDYNLFTDADELFNQQIETKIIDGKRYFNPKKKMKPIDKGTKILTIFTFALLDLVFISYSFMTGLAVKPSSEIYIQSFKDRGNVKVSLTSIFD